MNPSAPLASRAFSHRDQEAFAALSGDYNPMHMDESAARRTPAGACVVHGVQSFLWALEILTAHVPQGRLRGLDADFAQFLYVGEEASLHLVRITEKDLRAELRVGATRISQYVLLLGEPNAEHAEAAVEAAGPIHYEAARRDALPLAWTEVAEAAGTVDVFRPDHIVNVAYPALSPMIASARVNGLMALTRLVGMVSPGLHSTFHRISVKFTPGAASGPLRFATVHHDPRFSLVTIAVSAPGLSGTVKASRRSPPTRQPDSAWLRSEYPLPRFAGHTALVVGGSRGLGEVTAKLLGLAGVMVVISFATGAREAGEVAADIVAAGGRATTLKLDVLTPLGEQLALLPARPSSVYYFATQRITGRTLPGYSPTLFDRFCGVYVTAFHELCVRLSSEAERPLQVFYPSSVFVGEPTKGMAEYAMAKAAGEALAADLSRFNPKIRVESVRLPRVATDQTAGMIEQDMGSAAACMAPIVASVERRVDGA